MTIYTALVKGNAEPVLVREGFSWGALIVGPFWLAAHRAWVAAAISLAVYLLAAMLAPDGAATILIFGFAVILGLTGNDLRRWTLEQRGYLLTQVIAAADPDEAFVRLLARRPDLAAQFRPEPA